MQKRYLALLCLVPLLVIAYACIPSSIEAGTDTLERTRYNINATYYPKLNEVSGKATIVIPAQKVSNVDELYFRLYPNVFKDWKYDLRSKPTEEGSLALSNITLNGMSASYTMPDATLLKLPVSADVKAKGDVIVSLDYKLHLPKGGSRLNSFKQTAFLAQWYPMLAVHDAAGWHTEPYTTVGDPFYTEVADFDVTFRAPRGYKVISTGKDTQNDTGIFHVTQEKVRDFAAVITKDYLSISKEINNTRVNLWYLPDMKEVAAPLHEAACKSLQFFSKRFGEYPYPELDVVLGETGYGVAGMEYPGLVTSLPRLMSNGQGGIDEPAVNVVAHEVAHQWWYGMVGSNQCKEPWLDEGLTSFSEFWFMRDEMKHDVKSLLQQAITYSNYHHDRSGITSVDDLYKYPDNLYSLMIYLRPTAMMFALMNKVGESKVSEIMQAYLSQYRYKVATTEDFQRVATKVTEQDLTSFFNEWLKFE